MRLPLVRTAGAEDGTTPYHCLCSKKMPCCPGPGVWDDVMMRDLCYELLETDLPEKLEALISIICKVLAAFPPLQRGDRDRQLHRDGNRRGP